MATYVEMRTDGFARNLDDIAEKKALDFSGVRRPLRGIEIKEDTYAIIKVIRSDGREIPLVDSGSAVTTHSQSLLENAEGIREIPPEGSTFNYSNFIAQQIVDARQEKQQIVETFGEPYIFFYGEKPRVMQVQGLLMNTLDFNWKNEFWENYETYLRGTRLVELDARVYFYFDDQIVEGYILDAQASHSADFPYHVPFQFTMFVTAHTYIGLLDSTGLYPISANVQIPNKDLRQTEFFNQSIKKWRDTINKERRRRELLSTTFAVRHAVEKAQASAENKAALQGAIFRGLSQFEIKVNAFLDNVKNYFYGRRLVVPKGVAGSETYAGNASFANKATAVGKAPERLLPLRSYISDNYDEYIGGGVTVPTNVMEQDVKRNEIYEEDLEKKLLAELARLGVDVSTPSKMDNWRSEMTHSLTKTADAIDFAAGISIHGSGALVNKAKQLFELSTSLPGTIVSTETGLAELTVPPYIP